MRTRSGVDRTARVVDDVDAGHLVTRGIAFHHVPVEDREDFVEASETVQIGAVEVGEAAVAVADVGGHQRESGFGRIPLRIHVRNTIAIDVHEGAGIEVVLPAVSSDFSHIAGAAGALGIGGAHTDRGGDTVYDLVVPLVEDGNAPIADGHSWESKLALIIALGEGEVGTIRATDA